MIQTFDKHERFEGLRYLSRRRRGVPIRANSEKLEKRKHSLTALMNEGKQTTGACVEYNDANDDVFISSPGSRQISAPEIAVKVQRGYKTSVL